MKKKPSELIYYSSLVLLNKFIITDIIAIIVIRDSN